MTFTHTRVLVSQEERLKFYEELEDAFAFVVDGTGVAGRVYIAWMDEDGEIWAQRPAEEDEWALNRQAMLVDFADLPLPITVLPARRARPSDDPGVTLHELQARAYQQSADKGFHDDEPTEPRAVLSLNAERIALMHSELSEALEELRKGQPVNFTYYPPTPLPSSLVAEVGVEKAEELMPVNTKPEGVPSELADVVIRVLDFCGANGIDLQSMVIEKLDYNATRGHKHGKEF